jgi:hypothetical protein
LILGLPAGPTRRLEVSVEVFTISSSVIRGTKPRKDAGGVLDVMLSV